MRCSDEVTDAISDAGGINIEHLDDIGMATFDADSLLEIDDVTIIPNLEVANFPSDPVQAIFTEEVEAGGDATCGERRTLRRNLDGSGGYAPNSGDDDFFFDLQWFHEAVGSKAVWEKGTSCCMDLCSLLY